jgi:hypothetical protein
MQSARNDEEFLLLLAELIREQSDVAPLELLARVVLQAGDDAVGEDIFSSYDRFLSVLADPEARKQLESVRFEDATTNKTYDDLRETSRRFRDGVNALFFDKHPKLPALIREFGVF